MKCFESGEIQSFYDFILSIKALFSQGTRVQFPAVTWRLTTVHNSSSRRSNTFWSPRAPAMQVVHRRAFEQNNDTHKEKKKRPKNSHHNFLN